MPIGIAGECDMNSFPIANFPISHEDRAEILAIFIGLMEARDGALPDDPENPMLPLFDPPNSLKDLRSQWGLQ
jgi:hypothetical protein